MKLCQNCRRNPVLPPRRQFCCDRCGTIHANGRYGRDPKFRRRILDRQKTPKERQRRREYRKVYNRRRGQKARQRAYWATHRKRQLCREILTLCAQLRRQVEREGRDGQSQLTLELAFLAWLPNRFPENRYYNHSGNPKTPPGDQ